MPNISATTLRRRASVPLLSEPRHYYCRDADNTMDEVQTILLSGSRPPIAAFGVTGKLRRLCGVFCHPCTRKTHGSRP